MESKRTGSWDCCISGGDVMLHTLTIYECSVYDNMDYPSHTELISHRCFYSPQAMEEYARQVCSTYGEVKAEYAEQFADSVDIFDGGELLIRIKIDRHFDVEHWSGRLGLVGTSVSSEEDGRSATDYFRGMICNV